MVQLKIFRCTIQYEQNHLFIELIVTKQNDVAGEGVEVVDQRVAVCRDAAKGQCSRSACKYYHIPIALPPAPVMAALASYLQ